MSFSLDVKRQLGNNNNLNDKQAVLFELIGYLITGNCSFNKKKLQFSTESQYNIGRFSKLLNNNGIQKYDIQIQGKVYTITLNEIENEYIRKDKEDDKYILLKLPKDDKDKRSIIRGCFMGAGSITDPKNSYHLEIVFSNKENAKKIENILLEYEITAKTVLRNNDIVLYLKEGEEISNLLALIGANKAVVDFEQIRVMRDMRNSVNRLVNCETANIGKTINAAVKQIEAIQYLKKNKKFQDLSDSQKELANLRLENPDKTLQELGQMLQKPIGKSGVNHRLTSIMKIADDIKQNDKKEEKK